MAVLALASGWWDDADVLPFFKQMAQSDEHEFMRREAMEKLESGWHENPDIQKFLATLRYYLKSLKLGVFCSRKELSQLVLR